MYWKMFKQELLLWFLITAFKIDNFGKVVLLIQRGHLGSTILRIISKQQPLIRILRKRMFKPVECMPNEYFRCLFCSAHIFHGHSYNGKCTLKIT